ncbi:MAG: hypothetical protein LBH00_09015 [Planctomycetaceae bacterium]|nr:hypothetical protein [Planctomycetaceae bacterium]
MRCNHDTIPKAAEEDRIQPLDFFLHWYQIASVQLPVLLRIARIRTNIALTETLPP